MDTSREILGGLQIKKIKEIGETMFGLISDAQNYLHKISYETIPTYLYHKACIVLGRVKTWNLLHEPFQKHVRVFDILDAGDLHRFSIEGVRRMVVSNCQGTGHDLLVEWVDTYSRELDARGIEWHPIIIDFHDESIIEVEESRAEEALQVLTGSFAQLNTKLGNTIPLAGEGIVCDNLADIKIED